MLSYVIVQIIKKDIFNQEGLAVESLGEAVIERMYIIVGISD